MEQGSTSSRVWVGLSLLAAFSLSGCGIFFDSGSAGDPDEMEPTADTEPYAEPDDVPYEEPFMGDCVPADWEYEPDVGAPATFSLSGFNVRVEGSEQVMIESIEAPGHLSPAGDTPLVAFGDALVNGEIQGTLVVVGTDLQLGSGRLSVGQSGSVVVKGAAVATLPVAGEDDGVRPGLPAEAPPEHAAALVDALRFETSAEDLRLESYEEAYVVTAQGQVVPLSGPLSVTAPHMFAAWQTAADGVVTAQWSGSVIIGLDPTEGQLEDDSGVRPGIPSVLLTFDPKLRVSGVSVDSAEPVRTRLAMDNDGALLASGVEVRWCESEELVFYAGQTRILRLAYRQQGPATDAIFAGVFIDVDATPDAWIGRINPQGMPPGELVTAAEANSDTSWGQGFVDFVEGWIEVSAAIGRGAVCVFTLGFVCPDGSSGGSRDPVDPLLPFPGWMNPREYGEFQIEMTAPAEPGTYDVELHIQGDNYDAFAPVRVVVHE